MEAPETNSQSEMFSQSSPSCEEIAPGALLFRSFFTAEADVFSAVQNIAAVSPFRNMVTPGGYTMSVAMTNAGRLGWVSDRSGYRYCAGDPLTGNPWPVMPSLLLQIAVGAASAGGYQNFRPDVCLINRYEPGSKMSLHQDKDEKDFNQPIVSLSLGLPATFLFGGMRRSDRPARIRLNSGDVVVWGGVNRLAYHGIAPLTLGHHHLTGAIRINLTFRCGL